MKDGVQPPRLYLVAAIANVAERRGLVLRLTSGLDGEHSEWSGHYQGRAVDFGTKEHRGRVDLDRLAEDVREEVLRLMRLDTVADRARVYVAIHDRGNDNEHGHAQFK